MYGCLGFSNSRFYAKPLAELITLQVRRICWLVSAKPVITHYHTLNIVSDTCILTSMFDVIQGREILQSTVDLVQNNLNLEVISTTLFLEVLYDFIMYTRSIDLTGCVWY